MTSSPAVATPTQHSRSFLLALRSILARIAEKIGSGRAQEADLASCMELYHADESTLRDKGLTRMDVIRLLETKRSAIEKKACGFTDMPSRPETETEDPKWDMLPLAKLGKGLVSF